MLFLTAVEIFVQCSCQSENGVSFCWQAEVRGQGCCIVFVVLVGIGSCAHTLPCRQSKYGTGTGCVQVDADAQLVLIVMIMVTISIFHCPLWDSGVALTRRSSHKNSTKAIPILTSGCSIFMWPNSGMGASVWGF